MSRRRPARRTVAHNASVLPPAKWDALVVGNRKEARRDAVGAQWRVALSVTSGLITNVKN